MRVCWEAGTRPPPHSSASSLGVFPNEGAHSGQLRFFCQRSHSQKTAEPGFKPIIKAWAGPIPHIYHLRRQAWNWTDAPNPGVQGASRSGTLCVPSSPALVAQCTDSAHPALGIPHFQHIHTHTHVHLQSYIHTAPNILILPSHTHKHTRSPTILHTHNP